MRQPEGEGTARMAPEPLRVLVVEDMESDYELLLHLLKRGGFAATATRVDTADRMRGALNSAPWDFIISDYNVPSFGALPALAVLEQSGLDIPFLLMSGAIGEEAAVEAMRAGAEDYVPKDRPARLIPAIRRGLEAAAQRRERRAAEASLKTVAANLPGMLFRLHTDLTGSGLKFDYASVGCEALFGVEAEAILADPEALLSKLEPADRAALLTRFCAESRSPESLRGEFRVSRPRDATTVWIHVAASGCRDSLGIEWDGIITDITPIKEAEAKLIESQAQLRELAAHLQRAKEVERGNIAREIHDDIGGSLTAMRADIASLGRRVSDDIARERLASLSRLVDSAMQSTQTLSRTLRPTALDQGLYPALRWQARDFSERHGIPVDLAANVPDIELDLEISTALFRIFQEGLTNIAKHAGAHRVEATLFANASMVTLEIRDDGKGIEPRNLDKTGSFGVFGMYERVRNLGGWLEIDGTPGSGTTLMVSLPRKQPQEETA